MKRLAKIKTTLAFIFNLIKIFKSYYFDRYKIGVDNFKFFAPPKHKNFSYKINLICFQMKVLFWFGP